MASETSNVIKRHPVLLFFVLAFVLSWFPSLIAKHSINAMGPLMAATIVLALAEGRSGLRSFLGRIFRLRAPFRWYVLVLGLPPLFVFSAVELNLMTGATLNSSTVFPAWPEFLGRAAFILVVIGLGEEPAWRGFALPRLSAGRSLLAGSLILAPLHILWHLPLFGLEYDLQNGVPWALSVIAFSVLTAWVYRQTDGNLLLPALFHTSVNTFAIFLRWFSGSDSLRLQWILGSLYVATAIVVVAATGRNLARAQGPGAPAGEAVAEEA